MATVYLARDLRHDRPVALKVLHPELAATLGPDRFLREIKLAARLQHPHILSVHDSGEAAGRLWFTMPYVEGESLRDRLRRERQLPLDVAIEITGQVAQALDYAHQHGVIHRDIKPENILLTGDVNVLVADFGIARALGVDEQLTATGLSVGTPAYMSPEQAAGERTIDARNDVYSLGCVLYEMLAGEPPFTGPTAQAIIAKRFSTPVTPIRVVRPDIPVHVEQALTVALARAPAGRFTSAGEFARALKVAGATTQRRSRAALLVVPVAALLLIAGWVLVRNVSDSRAPLDGADPPERIRTIAVLPFVNMSGDPSNEYFSDGVTEEILNALTQSTDLRVAARTSAFQFKGKRQDVREIGRLLGVATILEGSIQRSGDAVRITAQLVDARTGYHLWSAKYDRRVENLFAVEDEIARTIADTLKVPLGFGSGAVVAGRRTADPVAHELYLRGLALIAERGPSLTSAIAYFDSALARDSNFAAAWAGLAEAHELRMYGREWGPDLAAAKRAAARALALDSALALAHGVTATLHRDEWEWAAADSSYRRSLALAPNDAETMDQYAQFLFQTDQLDAALRWEERARRLNPLAANPLRSMGAMLISERRYDSARTVLLEASKRLSEPVTIEWAIWASLLQHRYDLAGELVKRAADRAGGSAESYLALVRGVADPKRRAEALRVLREARAEPGYRSRQRTEENPVDRILWFAMLADTAGLYRELELHAARGAGETFTLWFEPLDRYRGTPRFRELLLRFNLPYEGTPLP
jgi:eukaryotic-like serine/threonine-protein kinase